MRVIRKKTYEEASMACAELIASQIRLKPDCKIGLATGSTPVGTYKDLVDMYKAGSLDFSKVTSANLDEYRGLGGDHDQSDILISSSSVSAVTAISVSMSLLMLSV